MYWTSVNGSLADAFATMQNQHTGKRVVGIMGAAQIDKYGNLNSTIIGDYFMPKVRFSGSGGAADVASFVGRTIIFMQHERRKFVSKVDYLTSPGWMGGPGQREAAGLPAGGPDVVITNMAVMGFDDNSREMFLRGVYPGISPRDVLAHMAFDVDVSRCETIQPPAPDELQILREACDPQRLILGSLT
jgi:glutaconate CoA-transferase subunit B